MNNESIHQLGNTVILTSRIPGKKDYNNPKVPKEIDDIVSNKSVVITGMIRDGEPDLLATLLQIEKLACHFDDVDIVILENNSKDNTAGLLDIWSKRPLHCDKKNVKLSEQNLTFTTSKYILHFTEEDDPAPSELSREDRFVFYRNYQLDYVTKTLLDKKREMLSNELFEYDYWMMIDFDVQSIDQKKILTEFAIASEELNVDVFCVNGMEWNGRYRDNFATVFTDGKWCFDDGVECHKRLQKKRFTQVRSCFGGLTLYSFGDIYNSKCRYHIQEDLEKYSKITHEWNQLQKNPKTNESWGMICEHIAFHDCLSSKIENLTMIFSRDSYLYYGFAFYEEWNDEPHVYGSSNRI